MFKMAVQMCRVEISSNLGDFVVLVEVRDEDKLVVDRFA